MKATILILIAACLLFLTAQAAIDINSKTQQPSAADLQLTSRVQQQLRSGIRNFNPNKLTILSYNVEVSLQGTVGSRAESAQIEKMVQLANGVTRVHNNMTIEN